ncbi:hypothetical protein NDU88_001391 [Pleurodeles waltl]|uniref:Retrotransposon gag domain-containing protein n=1 Tax=Pleurodeles waltl TaxID=8319 RepID=A0AAV7U6R8_PLEWA|nr:hypothetical protein NDU88_001391 [Pleurodeles waltl]
MSVPQRGKALSAQQQTNVHVSVTALPPFSYLADPATAAPQWRQWIGHLQHYFRATCETDGAIKRSIMLHMGGDELHELFEDLPNTRADDNFDATVAALNRYFDPQLNPDFKKFKCRQVRQAEGESVGTFLVASMCRGTDKQDEIRAQLT